MKNFRIFSLKSLRKSTIFEEIEEKKTKNQKIDDLLINKDFNYRFWEIFHPKNIVSVFFFFQIDITSPNLNKFWIGQKIWKAESLLFPLSTTFMAV